MLNIATPRPLAYIEQRRGLLVWQSYLVTEYVKGRELRNFLRDNKTSEEERSIAMQEVKNLLNKLGKYRITHGDLKHSNILITESGPVLTDLDAMRVHRWGWMFKIIRDKDITRLTKDEQTNRRKDEDKS
jgi:serine/threonine protein kinase